MSVFADPYARLIFDADHSESEDRFVLLGMNDKLKMLVVCHSYRKGDQFIRIFSAKKPTKQETKTYWEKRK